MSACLDKEKTLLLDAYEELDPQELAAWEKHIQTCDGCLHEKNRIYKLLRDIKQSIDQPDFNSKMEKILAENITHKVRKKKEAGIKRKKKPGKILWPLPAMAAACIVVLVIGTYSFKIFQTASKNHYQEDSNLAEMISTEELEIISNLDMLKDMDSISKIVQLVDHSEIDKSFNNTDHDIQGMVRHDYEKHV